MIQQRVIAEYQSETERAKQPGYVSRYDDMYEPDDVQEAERKPPAETKPTGERSHIQPAEVEPRAPHRPPAKAPANRPAQQQEKDDDFGAGIFD